MVVLFLIVMRLLSYLHFRRGIHGMFPLHLAALSGFSDCCRKLLSSGKWNHCRLSLFFPPPKALHISIHSLYPAFPKLLVDMYKCESFIKLLQDVGSFLTLRFSFIFKSGKSFIFPGFPSVSWGMGYGVFLE